MVIYYSKDSKVYSTQKQTINMPIEFEEFIQENFSKEDFSVNLDNVFSILEEYKQKGSKKYEIFGIIKDYDKIKEKLEKAKKKKPKDDDYTFVEITSQILIIKQLKDVCLKIESNFPPERIIKKLDELENEHSKKRKLLEKEEEKLKSIVKEEKEKIELLKNEELNKKIKKNNQLKKSVSALREKEIYYENILDSKTKKSSNKQPINSLEKEIKALEFEQESISYDIKLLEAKLKTLKNEKKLGVQKKVNPLLMILTLGLIYWTKYATISYQITSTHLKILKKEEKISLIKKKIFIKNHKKDSVFENLNSKNKNDAKEQEDIVASLEKTQQSISSQQKEIVAQEKEIEKAKSRIKPLEENVLEKEEKLKKINSELKKQEKTSKDKGFEIIKEIEKNHKDVYQTLEELEKKLEYQTINYKGESIITLQ